MGKHRQESRSLRSQILEAPSAPAREAAILVCKHCCEPIAVSERPIVWHDYHFHVWCAKKLLIVAQMTKDELVKALEGREREADESKLSPGELTEENGRYAR